MKKRRVIFSIVALIVLLFGSMTLYNYLSNNNIQKEKEKDNEYQIAPDFAVYNQKEEEVKLSDFQGKYVVINFWASWCGFCRDEMESFNDIYNEYIDQQDFEILMINVTDGSQETKENANDYYDENGFDFPIYYDHNLDATKKYGTNSLPVTYLINKKGEIVGGRIGYFEKSLLEEAVKKLIEES